MSNQVKYYIARAMMAVVLMFTAGGIVQSFFAERGMSVSQISTYTATVSAAQVVIMILNIFVADRVKDVKRTYAILVLCQAFFCVLMLPFSILTGFDVKMLFGAALVGCCIQNTFVGFSNVLSYRLPYLIVDMKEYASLENINGIVSGVVSIAAGALISTMTLMFDFGRIMAVGFFVSILFCVASFGLYNSMHIKNIPIEEKKNPFTLAKLMRKDFVYFYLPNFLRGLCMGLMNVIAVICMKNITTNESVLSFLVTILSVSSIVGCSVYQALRKKISTVQLYAACSVLMFILLPLMLLGRSSVVFCIIYFFVGMAYNIINIAGAVYITEFIGYEDIGMYTSVRLIVMTAAQAISGAFIGMLIDSVSSVLIVGICGACQLISGIFYYLWDLRYQTNLMIR